MNSKRIHFRIALFGGLMLVNALWTLGNVVVYPIILLRSFLDMKQSMGNFEAAITFYLQGVLFSWPIYLSAILKIIGYAICGVMYAKAFVSYRSGRYIRMASTIYVVAHFQYAIITLMTFYVLPNGLHFIPAVLAYIGANMWDTYSKELTGQRPQSLLMKWPYWRAIEECRKGKQMDRENREL